MQVLNEYSPAAITVPDASTPDLGGGLSNSPISPISNGIASSIGGEDPTSPAIKSEDGGRVKPKQKRNKPTLSCLECVERKTKCRDQTRSEAVRHMLIWC